MKFVNIDVDEQGHSFFRDVDLPQYGTAQRISSKNQKVLWWKMTQSKPGHFVDFQRGFLMAGLGPDQPLHWEA